MRSQELTRDQRLEVLTLHRAGFTCKAISDYFKEKRSCLVTIRQCQWAINAGHPTPQKKGHNDRKALLSKEQIDKIEAYICSSKAARFTSFLRLATGPLADLQVSGDCIRKALYKRGYRRYIAHQKPPLSEENRRLRLAWAQEHRNWTLKDWFQILWTDETWVTGARHRKQWVTRKQGEELHPDCIMEKIQRRKGWMFWGSFAGGEKGPCLFWEKEWKSINQDSYAERIVPLIHGWIRLNPHLFLMQDNAPGHAGKVAQEELFERGIRIIFWPPYSPDLNPIETVWNWMKDWIEAMYGFDKVFNYDELRKVVKEAWEAVPREKLMELLESMPQRCQDVIDAEGGFTKW